MDLMYLLCLRLVFVFYALPLGLQPQVSFRRAERFFDLILCYRLPLPRILSHNVVPHFWDLYIKQRVNSQGTYNIKVQISVHMCECVPVPKQVLF